MAATSRCARLSIALGIALAAVAPEAYAQASAAAPGAEVFDKSCRSCHSGDTGSRAPAVDALRARTPQAIIESLVNGAMRVQGARLTGVERRAVAEFITGKTVGGDVSGAAQGRCITSAAAQRSNAAPAADARTAWNGWGGSITNARSRTAEQAGLSARDLSRLTLKWAFGFPDASSAWAQPAVVDGRIFVGSQNGTVYSLDSRSGCVHWTFAAAGGVRTAISVEPATAANKTGRVFFGDTSATAYAVDAATGRQLWSRRVDDHPLARMTSSPVLHDGRLYVGLSSYEEAQGSDPGYGCCTFRGSVTALDAATGAIVWKTYLITEEPKPRGRSSAGVTLWGPSGAAVWSAPTIDVKRGMVYVATGNAYSAPATSASDAVIALDLRSGAIKWTRQMTANDVYLSNCRGTNPNCPEKNGPDFDFGSPPILTTGGGRELLVIGQKSGVAFGLDPDKQGEIVWQYRAGQGGVLGGIEWGAAVDNEHAYFAVSDMTHPQPGGLHAVRLTTGERAWYAAPVAPACGSGRGCNAAQSAAVTAIPGAVFSGSNDGMLRAYSAADGSVLWQFDSNREFQTVNGVAGRGASMLGPGPVIAGGMLFVNSGYGAFGGRPGNVLLAFGLE